MDMSHQPLSRHLSPQEIEALVVALRQRWWLLGGLIRRTANDDGMARCWLEIRRSGVELLLDHLRDGTATVEQVDVFALAAKDILVPVLERIANPLRYDGARKAQTAKSR